MTIPKASCELVVKGTSFILAAERDLMKNLFAFLALTGTSFLATAQEYEPTHSAQWSDQTKIYWLIAITALSLFLVARTFRNKPEA